ncbi:MAG: hypothetical protein DBP02_02010 [gamma proteobacterium symbiont of Ctena orbiculata]|nr:MAG: hypothetical protein DBP02_02010 [gamma proteobacterium symbiont of Ctena orbiculata]
MNNGEKTPAHQAGDTVVAKTLAKLMLADPDINGSPTKLANAINKTVLKNSDKKANQPTIARILSGEIEDPKHPVLWPIAEYFGSSTDLFYKKEIENKEIAAAIVSSEIKRLKRFYLEADPRGRDTILTVAKQQAEWKELAESEQGAETPGDVPDSHKYNSDDPELKLKEGEAQVVEVEKKKPAVKKVVKKKAARTVKTKK